MRLDPEDVRDLAAFCAKRFPDARARSALATQAGLPDPGDGAPVDAWTRLVTEASQRRALGRLANALAAAAPGDENLQAACRMLGGAERPRLAPRVLGIGAVVLVAGAAVAWTLRSEPPAPVAPEPHTAAVAEIPRTSEPTDVPTTLTPPTSTAPTTPTTPPTPTAPTPTATTPTAPPTPTDSPTPTASSPANASPPATSSPAETAPVTHDASVPARTDVATVAPILSKTTPDRAANRGDSPGSSSFSGFRCDTVAEPVAGWWYTGANPGNTGDLVTVPHDARVRADYPRAENHYNARFPERCVLPRGAVVRLTHAPVEVSHGEWWAPYAPGDRVQ
jgi:hypothetical protein